MRELSSETVAAIREAREAASSHRGGAPVRAALDHVAASGEWAAIPHVLAMVLDPLPAVSEAARRAVQALLHAVPVHELPRLDQLARARSSWSWGDLDVWLALSPRDLDRLASLPEGPSLLQLATMHPSGFVREAAIRRTAVCSDGREAPCYVLRLNDWVGAVRGAAVAALRARLRAACADELVAALPLLDVARRWGRIDAPDVLAELEAFVVGPAAASALRAAVDAPDRATRRAAFRRAFTSAIPAAEVIERAIREPDALVRGRAVDALRADGAVDAARPLAALLGDPAGAVRARALQLALDRGVPVELDPFLFDAHVSVRSLAQAALLAVDVDVVARYRAALATASGRRLAAAVVGLAETGGADEAPAIRGFLAHDRPRVRRGALHGLVLVRADDLAAACLRALADPSPAVAHAARDLLRRRAARVTPAQVWGAYEAATTDAGRIDALSVLGDLDYWERLPYLLRATTSDAPAARDRALHETRRWVARASASFSTPSRAALDAIRAALAVADLPAPVRRAIDAVVRSRAPAGA